VTDHRSRIVKRVVHSLEQTRHPETLVWQYFEGERDALVQATLQTLAATREDMPEETIEEAVEAELVEALRYPTHRPGGVLPALWVHRGAAATVGLLTILATLALVLL